MKRDGKKIVGVVVWDYQMASIVDRAGVEIVSVGDSVGLNLWGHPDLFEITMDQMVTVAQAARRGTNRAMVSCDFPYGPLQEGTDAALKAGVRLVKEADVDMIKLDGAADFPDAVTALTDAGIGLREQCWMPIAAEQITHRCTRPGLSQQVILVFFQQRVSLGFFVIIWRRLKAGHATILMPKACFDDSYFPKLRHNPKTCH